MKKNKDIIDEIIDVYRELMPETAYLVINEKRYNEAMAAIKEIREIVEEYDKDVVCKVEKGELIGTTLHLEITSDMCVIDKIDKFCNALKVANVFEITPLTTGKVSLAISFYDVYRPAPAYGTPEAEEHNRKAREQN